MYIDSHAHIYKEYYEDIKKVSDDAIKNNVLEIINCATDFDNFNEIIDLSKQYDFYYTLGLHPETLSNYQDINLLERYIKENIENSKFLGIGEIGLDYHYSLENKKEQKDLFEYQLSLADKYSLPVIIHSRDATMDTLNILKQYNLKGIIHCFSGSVSTAKEYVKLGYKLGIGGVITFKNCNLKEYIESIGLENIVLETDSPYMTPEPLRKYKNEPKNIKIIAEFIAKIFNRTAEEVGNITTNNCKEIFDFKKKK